MKMCVWLTSPDLLGPRSESGGGRAGGDRRGQAGPGRGRRKPPPSRLPPPAAAPELAAPLPARSLRTQLLSDMAKMSSPTETERCIESLIAVFQKYAGKDGNKTNLSKTEFLSFMNTELAAFTKSQKDAGVLDRMMKRLDVNSDGQLDFQEFLNLIGGLAVACHESLTSSRKFI
ncbi:protein S100-A11 [Rhinolophus ferrumequinum]|nr:protein S100-A11 [Rhinolophus ferrumequinum]